MHDELFVAMWCSKIDCMQCMCLGEHNKKMSSKNSQNKGQVLLLIRQLEHCRSKVHNYMLKTIHKIVASLVRNKVEQRVKKIHIVFKQDS